MKKKILPRTAGAVLWDNTYSTISPYIQSMGFVTSLLKFADQEQHYNLAEDFLVNSYLKRDDIETESSISYYLSDGGLQTVSMIDTEKTDDCDEIELIKSSQLNLSLGQAIVNRQSVRHYTGDAIQFADLTSILQAGNGVSRESEVALSDGETVLFSQRTVPSGGGLYPVSIYLAALNIKGLAKAIYRYQSVNDVLLPVLDAEHVDQLIDTFAGSKDIFKTSGAILLLVGQPWRSLRKYGNKGMRFVFHETGGISQNIHLAVTALGLGSVDYASFYENEAHKVLGFDGLDKVLLHSIIIGVPGV